jgi:hypothetical protein
MHTQVLDLDTRVWHDVSLAFKAVAPRAGHAGVLCTASGGVGVDGDGDGGASLLLWGGGDNDVYFKDVHVIRVADIDALCA